MRKTTEQRLREVKEEFSRTHDIETFENKEGYNQMIVQRDIPFMALCEHHHLSFQGSASIGYLPSRHLVGLSKLARIVEAHLNPTIYTIQERATQDIARQLEDTLKSKGVIVVLKAQHNCIAMRGVKKPSLTITCALSGRFKDHASTRLEFFELLRQPV